jgi:hypothetical protein
MLFSQVRRLSYGWMAGLKADQATKQAKLPSEVARPGDRKARVAALDGLRFRPRRHTMGECLKWNTNSTSW